MEFSIHGCFRRFKTRMIAAFRIGHERVWEVTPGALYRSSQPDVRMLEHAVRTYGIHTVVNLRAGEEDPDLGKGYCEERFCRDHGLQYLHLPADDLYHDLFPSRTAPHRPCPRLIEEFMTVMNHSPNHPVLIHCAGGKHRTGFLTAVYRIENQGWSSQEAISEMLDHGVKHNDFDEHPHVWDYLKYLDEAPIAF